MNIEFEAALRYIDMGSYDKAVKHLMNAIEKEEGNAEEFQYRCVLGELYANIGKHDEAREEFNKVLDYCDETNSLDKQRHISQTYLDALDGKLPEMPEQPARAAKRPGDVPLVPKPQQNKGFIARQSRKNHR